MDAVETETARIPTVGLGTWQSTGTECTQTVRTALDAGYRHIDTAQQFDLLPVVNGEDSHGTAPLDWDIRVCASLGGCSRLESVSPAELNDARLGQTAVIAIPQRGSHA